MAYTASWTDAELALWERLSAHPFEHGEHATDFTGRLAREHGWSYAIARSAIAEYRRFCFLAVAAGHPVTPGVEVDEVWHLHLTHSRDYWNVFCPAVLGCALHHEPTRGGADEAHRHYSQYAQTLASYQRYFGVPPARFWPKLSEQFGSPARFRRVDLRRVHLLPRLSAWSARAPSAWDHWRRFMRARGLAASMLMAAPGASAADNNPLEWSGPQFLRLFLLLLVVAFFLAAFLRRRLRNTGDRPVASNLDTAAIAYLAGGSERLVDSSVAELLADGALSWDTGQRRLLRNDDKSRSLAFPLDIVAQQVDGSADVKVIASRIAPRLQPLRDRLQQRGMLLTDAQIDRVRRIASMPLFALVLFGALKIQIGIQRDRPVAFLVVLTLVALIGGIITYFTKSQRSIAGDQVLAQLRTDKTHATRAPRTSDMGIAVALAGTAVLSGTAYAAYHEARAPAGSSSSSDSSSSSSSDSDSGSDGGGGGCGGCGGGGGD